MAALDGSIVIDGLTVKISRQLRMSRLPLDLVSMITSRRDTGTGWTWLGIGGLTLDDNPCTFSLGFFHEHLPETSWSVRAAGADYAGGRPSPDTVAKTRRKVAC